MIKDYLNSGSINNSNMSRKEDSPNGNILPRTLKKGPVTGLNARERLERYSVLLQFEKVEDVNTLALAEQWEVHRLSVSGMLSAAKNSKQLYKDMKSLGYVESQFPVWWYSPARDTQVQQSADQSADVQTSDAKFPKSTFIPISPRKPTYRADSLDRPPVIPQDSTSQDSTPSDSPRHDGTRGTSQLSESDLKLLASQLITEVTPGRWMRTVERSDGSIVLTPVDPHRELLSLKRSAQGDRIMNAVGEQMITSLSVHTQAILKKVAFNPNVFQCWQYVSNAVDPETGHPFVSPDWDFGDFVSHCILWTTEHEFGVVPTVIFNRPSRYTQYKEIMRHRNQGNPYYYDENRGDRKPISHLDLPSRWGEEREDQRE